MIFLVVFILRTDNKLNRSRDYVYANDNGRKKYEIEDEKNQEGRRDEKNGVHIEERLIQITRLLPANIQ